MKLIGVQNMVPILLCQFLGATLYVFHVLVFKQQRGNLDWLEKTLAFVFVFILNHACVRQARRNGERDWASPAPAPTRDTLVQRSTQTAATSRSTNVEPSSANQKHFLRKKDARRETGREGPEANKMTLRATTQRMSVNIYELFAAGGLASVFDGFRQISATTRVVLRTPLQRICCFNLSDVCRHRVTEYFIS